MKCPHCGANTPREEKICQECDTSLDIASSNPSQKAAFKLLSRMATSQIPMTHEEAEEEKDPKATRRRPIKYPKKIFESKKKKEEEEAESETNEGVFHYLISPPSRPIRLQKNKVLTIGREEENGLMLPYQEVSRSHGEITWEEESGFVIFDKESANGTIVNGEMIDQHLLYHGDKIQIGPVILEFRAVKALSSKTPEESLKKELSKKTLRVNPQRAFTGLQSIDPQDQFSGNLKTVAVYQILQILAMEQKSGEIKLFQQNKNIASISLLDGLIVDASFDELHGREAFYQISQISEGRFEYDPTIVPQEIVMSDSIEGLLLECARIMDESERGDDQVEGAWFEE